MAKKKRVLSGMRPTGRMHLGHLTGALENWVKLQDEYECFFFVADWHALTTDYADTQGLTDSTFQMIVDWLAVGLDPKKSTFFVQSHILEHAELHLLFSMITPLGWLERVPSYKEQRENIRDRDLGTYGFLGYPMLQAADILIYRAHYVPVGEDQVAHVEFTREVARRFSYNYHLPSPDPEIFSLENRAKLNALLKQTENIPPVPEGEELSEGKMADLADTLGQLIDGREKYHKLWPMISEAGLSEFVSVFPEPEALLTPAPKLPGLDGRKMSKSYLNVIELGDSPETIRNKVRGMLTDPQRMRREDPGRPEICPVFGYHQRFSPADEVAQVEQDCRVAAIGCVDCKKKMVANLVPILEPIQERRRHYESSPGEVWEILTEGTERAHKVADYTLQQVRRSMHMVPRGARYEGASAADPLMVNLDLDG